jgi:hypothetical protein
MNTARTTSQAEQRPTPLAQTSTLSSTIDFTRMILWANVRNLQALALNLGTPLGIIAIYILSGSWPLPAGIVPLLFVLSIMFNGLTLGARIIMWGENKVFQRLAVTSTPMSHIIVGLFLSQLILSIAQAFVALAVVMLAGVSFSASQLIIYLYAIVLSCFTFTALGPLVATIVNRADMLNYAYIFFLMPLAFFGYFTQYGADQASITAQIAAVLPTSLMTNLLDVINNPISLQTGIISSLGLLLYGVLFLAGASYRSRRLLRNGD